jgi:hypothetical protein
MWKPAWDKKMAIPLSIETKWVDIVPPLAPPSPADPYLLVLCVVAVVALIGAGMLLYLRPRQRTRRALRRLSRDLRQSRVQAKAACFQVRECLRSPVWTHGNDAGWQVYLDRLSQYCFSAEAPDPEEADAVIAHALAWLDQKVAES